jgi:hypothetical protein
MKTLNCLFLLLLLASCLPNLKEGVDDQTREEEKMEAGQTSDGSSGNSGTTSGDTGSDSGNSSGDTGSDSGDSSGDTGSDSGNSSGDTGSDSGGTTSNNDPDPSDPNVYRVTSYQIYRIETNAFEVEIRAQGDQNRNSQAFINFCNYSKNSNCDPAAGPKVEIPKDKYGNPFWIKKFVPYLSNHGINDGDQVKIKLSVNDQDGVLFENVDSSDQIITLEKRVAGFPFVSNMGESTFQSAIPLAQDSKGNILSAGKYRGSNIDFDPNLGVKKFTSSENGNGYTAFLTKFDKNGNLLKAVNLGHSSSEGAFTEPYALTVDSKDNILVFGMMYGNNIKFGTHEFNSVIGTDGRHRTNSFLVKMNANLEVLWVHHFDSVFYHLSSRDMGIDASDNVYVTMGYICNSNKDIILTTSSKESLDIDSCATNPVIKFDKDGQFKWITYSPYAAWTMAISDDGSVFLADHTFTNFDNYYPKDLTGTNAEGLYVTRFNSDGSYAWSKFITGGVEKFRSRIFKLKTKGNDLYIAGRISGGKHDFDPNSPGTDIREEPTLVNSQYSFVSKWKQDGSYQWTTTIRHKPDSMNMDFDKDGNLLVLPLLKKLEPLNGADLGSATNQPVQRLHGSFLRTQSILVDKDNNVFLAGDFLGRFKALDTSGNLKYFSDPDGSDKPNGFASDTYDIFFTKVPISKLNIQ